MLFPGLMCALDRDGSSHINLTVNRNNAVIGGTFVEYDMSKKMSGGKSNRNGLVVREKDASEIVD